jgi:DNA polymerase-1
MSSTSKGYRFIKHLGDINQRKTAVSYLEGYKRFCMPYFQPEHIRERFPQDQWEYLLDFCVLHPSINLTGTRTTRQSSNSPNGQNISKKEGFNLRSVFGPTPKRVWYSVDYANIELRVLAWESEEEELIEAFLRGESIHMKFARIICPEAIERAGGPEKFKKTQQYRYVKNGDFALTYGASYKTADAAYHIPGAYHKVRGHFTRLDSYMHSIVSLASRRGYVTTRMGIGEGYPLYVTPGKAYTQAVDYICQGTAGWAMLLAIIQCHEYLSDYPEHNMIMTIHDELLFDFPSDDDNNGAILANCCHLMEASGNHIAVPLKAEAEVITTTWDKSEPITP